MVTETGEEAVYLSIGKATVNLNCKANKADPCQFS